MKDLSSEKYRLSRRDLLQQSIGFSLACALPNVISAGSHGNSDLARRAIPSSGEMLPVIGLGTSRVFDVGDSDKERLFPREVVRLLLDGGGTLIDSSPMYGKAETVSGDVASELGLSDQVFWATKVWTEGRDEGIAQMEESMRRFKVEQIDLMQVHNLKDWKTHLRTLQEWKEQERIRYVGVTHSRAYAFEELANVIRSSELDFVQLNYSLAERDAEEVLLPLCQERGIATLINRPFARGELFKRVQGVSLPPWAGEFDAGSWAQVFLKFILAHPAVTCLIPATSDPGHMIDNVGGGVGRLPDESQRKQIISFLDSL